MLCGAITLPMQDSVDGVVEIAALHPFVAGGLAAVYLGNGRFHPDKNAPVFDPAQEFETATATENGNAALTVAHRSVSDESSATVEGHETREP